MHSEGRGCVCVLGFKRVCLRMRMGRGEGGLDIMCTQPTVTQR